MRRLFGVFLVKFPSHTFVIFDFNKRHIYQKTTDGKRGKAVAFKSNF